MRIRPLPKRMGPPDPRKYQISLWLALRVCGKPSLKNLRYLYHALNQSRDLYRPGQQADLPPWPVAKHLLESGEWRKLR
jgi:hypothetical protein